MVETIFLVRHAEAESNAQRFYGGWLDSPLTPLGLKQAESLKKRLGREDIGRTFCSDLQRAKQTYKLLDFKCPVKFTRALRERGYGTLEGVKYDDDPMRRKHHMDPRAKMPGGESAAEVQKRVWLQFQENIFPAREEKVLVLTHHGPLVTFMCKFLGMPLSRWKAFKMGNAGLSILVKEDGLWRLKLWNSLSALGLLHDGPFLNSRAANVL